jgi:hypothetical protein
LAKILGGEGFKFVYTKGNIHLPGSDETIIGETVIFDMTVFVKGNNSITFFSGTTKSEKLKST